jgi:hypothetical protein
VHRAVMSMMRLTATGESELPGEMRDAEQRWQQMLTDELGDPVRARLVRLVGDGLFMAALTGPSPASDEVEQLPHRLGPRTRTGVNPGTASPDDAIMGGAHSSGPPRRARCGRIRGNR